MSRAQSSKPFLRRFNLWAAASMVILLIGSAFLWGVSLLEETFHYRPELQPQIFVVCFLLFLLLGVVCGIVTLVQSNIRDDNKIVNRIVALIGSLLSGAWIALMVLAYMTSD